MTPAITLQELFAWCDESAIFWNAHLEANPALLQLPCDIGGTANVQEFVRHIWSVDLIWSQRLTGETPVDRATLPMGPLPALFELHRQGFDTFRRLLNDPAHQWDATQTLKTPWLPPEGYIVTHRKMLAHALFHSQRHWAQLATLVRVQGFPSGFRGDLLLSSALD